MCAQSASLAAAGHGVRRTAEPPNPNQATRGRGESKPPNILPLRASSRPCPAHDGTSRRPGLAGPSSPSFPASPPPTPSRSCRRMAPLNEIAPPRQPLRPLRSCLLVLYCCSVARPLGHQHTRRFIAHPLGVSWPMPIFVTRARHQKHPPALGIGGHQCRLLMKSGPF
jgi:hypothetical protein